MTPRSASLPPSLRLFAALAFAISSLCWAVAALAPRFHWPFPFTTPLAPPGTTFYDFFDYVDRFPFLHTARFFSAPGYPFTYFAPGIFLYRLFYLPGPHAGLHLYLALSLGATAVGAILLALHLRRNGLSSPLSAAFVLVSALTSYPLLFCLERGNLEILIAVGIALGLWAFCSGHPTRAALLWGLFGSIKLYPLVLLALFLSRRQVRPFCLALGTALATNLLALWYAGPTVLSAFTGIRRGTHVFVSMYSLTQVATEWDHSLFSLPKWLLYPSGMNHRLLLGLYLPLAAGSMLVLYVVRLRHLPFANQVVIYSTAMVLLPPTSFDYTLVQLYGAWTVLATLAVQAYQARQRVPGPTAAFALFAIAFTPGNLLTIAGRALNGQSKSLALLTLLILATRIPFTPRATLAESRP